MEHRRLWRWRLDHLLTILRVVLGVILLSGGSKSPFPLIRRRSRQVM